MHACHPTDRLVMVSYPLMCINYLNRLHLNDISRASFICVNKRDDKCYKCVLFIFVNECKQMTLKSDWKTDTIQIINFHMAYFKFCHDQFTIHNQANTS